MAMSKKARRQKALARKKRKKIIIITAVAVVVVAIVVVAVVLLVGSAGTETYSDGSQTIQFLPDGTFTATLSHSRSFSGTYAKTEQGDITIVAFTSSGVTVNGEIEGGLLYIPHEWDDGHGHGAVLTKK